MIVKKIATNVLKCTATYIKPRQIQRNNMMILSWKKTINTPSSLQSHFRNADTITLTQSWIT